MSTLTGQLLVAMPQMSDPFFARSVVYLCAHSEDTGAMGLVINKTIDSLTVDELYAQLKIEPATHSNRPERVHFGGPVAPGYGFVLHSPDYREEGTLGIGEEFAMTATVDILRAKGMGGGPRQTLVALGYAGWGPGQLEGEIGRQDWFTTTGDPKLIFDDDRGDLRDKAMARRTREL